MKVIGPHEVEMTPEEVGAHTHFDDLLDLGHNIPDAAARTELLYPNLDPNFYRWLRDEPITLATYTDLRDFLDRYTNDLGEIQGDPATIAAEAVAAGLVKRDENHDTQMER